MKIYNQAKTEIIENPNMKMGYLVDDKILVETLPAQEEKSHYEVVREYENGGKDVKKVIDVEGREETKVYEDIKVYVPYTTKELSEIEYYELKDWFNNEYSYKEQKLRRLIALNKLDDDNMDASLKLNMLYNEAETKRLRIQMLEKLI